MIIIEEGLHRIPSILPKNKDRDRQRSMSKIRPYLKEKEYREYTASPRPLLLDPNQKAYKRNMRIGSTVLIVEKKNQKTGILTRGRIVKFLTNKPFHPRGIKVILDNGKIGRVQYILVY